MAAIPHKPEFFGLEESSREDPIEIDESELDPLPYFPSVPGPVTLETTPKQDLEAQLLMKFEKDLIDDMGPVKPIVGPNSQVDPNSKASQVLAKRTKGSLSIKSLAFRNRFITEYIADFDPELAWIRAGGGGKKENARNRGKQLLREAYVSRKVREMIDIMDEKELINRNRVIAGFVKEASYHGPGASHAARVAALKGLSGILGMEQVNVNVKGKVDHTVRGGVMVVPVVPGSDDWEKLAANSQKQLKEDVRS